MNKSEKKILVCPLPWGLGHTTRMIPLIRNLMSAGCSIIFAGTRWQTELIKNEISGLSFIRFPGFSIRYSSFLPQSVIIFLYFPLFVYHTIREHFMLKKIIAEHHPDIVISDCRIGLWNRKIRSVLITHIIRLPFPRSLRFLENLFLPLSRAVIKKFTLCLIPDFPGDINLSGRLSHGFRLPENVRYIGILSRFEEYIKVASCIEQFPETESPSEKPISIYREGKANVIPPDDYKTTEGTRQKDIFFTAIMSGPSPQKEILTSKMKGILLKLDKNSVIMAGNLSGGLTVKTEGNIRIINHLTEDEFADIVRRSEIIVSRSGYTTVMELFSLGRSAILIPTPGQPEQEYLAEYLSGKGWFLQTKQKNLNLNTLKELPDIKLPAFNKAENEKLLHAVLKELLEE